VYPRLVSDAGSDGLQFDGSIHRTATLLRAHCASIAQRKASTTLRTNDAAVPGALDDPPVMRGDCRIE
jgi:hypothetical protein